ncbi:IS110 family transposase [Ornithinimicrobium cryptoxanthini]|nr:IS110 family transposase [Ornithinimicrobium cryptoxanthini]
MDLHGVGPVVAARILADVGDMARFADRNRFASWTGTAPLDALLRRAEPATPLPRWEPADDVSDSSAAGSRPHTGTSDQPLPGHAPTTPPLSATPAQPRPRPAPQQPRRRARAVKVQRPPDVLTATSVGARSKEPILTP